MQQLMRVGFVFLLLAGTAGAWDQKPLVAKIELANGDGLVFLGDSITHQSLYTQYVEDYFYTRYPERRIRFHNSGVGGDRCADALVRFDADVAHFKPKYVTILLGMNDGAYQAYNQSVFETYERDMLQVIDRIRSIGATPIVMTPTMFDATAARLANRGDDKRNRYYNATLAYYGALLREEAITKGLGFVDMYSPLNNITVEQRKTDPKFTLIRDAVHPDAPGQVVMAAAIIEALHPNRNVSTIQIGIGRTGHVRTQATGGRAIGIETDGEHLSFTFVAEALPWVLPAEAALGYRLTHSGHRLSRESLRVVGLKAGNYELKIDGVAVGTYTDAALARGIELQENAKTPQHQQALAVAMLNKERNDQAVRPLRNLWGAKKGQRFAEAAAKANPNDKKAAERLTGLNAQLAEFDKKIAELVAKAKGFEDKIYQSNRPKEHRYELAPK